MRKLFGIAAVFLGSMAGAAHAGSVFEVSSTGDSGAGSLRAAILAANANAGTDLIVFNIPEGSCSPAGTCMIPVLTDLPAISDAVTIDGTTQPRYGSAPDNVCARPGIPSRMRIELAGGPGVQHLSLESPEPSVVRGLSIGGGISGVLFASPAEHWVYCNHIGVDAAGTAQKTLVDAVCFFCAGGDPIVTGGVLGTNGDNIADLAERNVIAASFRGVNQNSGSDFTVSGNYIGLGADGITAISTDECVYARQGTSDSTYGSNLDGVGDENERNILGACSTGFLLEIDPFGSNNSIAGNWIGLNAAGDIVAMEDGIRIIANTQSARVVGNRIEGATSDAIVIQDSATIPAGSDGNCIANNLAGLTHESTAGGFDITNNWWGDASGPSGLGPGSGDPISETTAGAVAFDPWLTAAPDSCRRRLLHGDGFEGPPLP